MRVETVNRVLRLLEKMPGDWDDYLLVAQLEREYGSDVVKVALYQWTVKDDGARKVVDLLQNTMYHAHLIAERPERTVKG